MKKSFDILTGMTIVKIDGKKGDDDMIFFTSCGRKFKLYHAQDWCESVTVEDICGDLNDLVGHPIIIAEEVSNEQDTNPEGVEIPSYQDSFTWTFYKLATIKGSVTIRWYGESNGYYSEYVEFIEITNSKKKERKNERKRSWNQINAH